MKILIVGGTGFIGRHLSNKLSQGNEVFILARKVPDKKQAKINYITVLSHNDYFDIIINLAGARLDNSSWSEKFKKELFESRIFTTEKIINYIKSSIKRPQLLINASAIGIYGSDPNKEFIETDTQAPTNFSQHLCTEWEKIASTATNHGVKLAILRFGVVLGKDDGFLKKLMLPFKIGFGMVMGTGNEWFSWVHINDVVKSVNYIIKNKLEGLFNVTSPAAVKSAEFAKTFASVLGRPLFFRLPPFIIRFIFGQMGQELILASTKVMPKNLLDAGYKFKYQELNSALKDLVK